jgi:hypothetical protein
MTLLLLLAACGQPTHLQYDHGRAMNDAMRIQADLTRDTVKDSLYPLSGFEAAEIRLRAAEATAEEKSGEAEAIEKK